MDLPLIETKLYCPPPWTVRVRRPRLYARLDPLLRARLGVVRAPAGYGKTTAVADWLDDLAQRSGIVVPGVAWLSLDPADDEPVRFLSYVLAALREVYPRCGAAIQRALAPDADPPLEPLFASLANEILTLPTQCILVLDDYHYMECGAIHAALDLFVDHLPPQLHLLLITRSTPPLALDRLRVHGALVEVGHEDLALTRDEAEDMLRALAGEELSVHDTKAVLRRCQGWAAGVQLASLALRGQDAAQRRRFIEGFGGRQRSVSGYLLGEALAQQPRPIVDLLLRTSIVERLCAGLCAALCPPGDASSTWTLADLEARGLFLTPLDERREWYHYHGLFRDLLCQRLEREHPALVPELHLRASEWFAKGGHIAEAIEHALQGNAPERAADLIDAQGYMLALPGGDSQLLTWLRQIPALLQRHRPWLRIAHLNALCRLEQYDALDPLLESLAADVALFPSVPVAAAILLVRAWCTMRRRYEPQSLLSLGLRALDQLTGLPDSPSVLQMRCMAELYVGHGQWNLGHLHEAETAFLSMLRLGQRADSAPATLTGFVQLAYLYQAVGPFSRCMDVCREGIALAETSWATGATPAPPPDLVGNLEGLLSLMLLLRHRLDEAETHASRSVAMYELSGSQPGHLAEAGLLNLAWVSCSRGDHQGAYALLRRIERLLRGCAPEVAWQVQPKLVRLRIALAGKRTQWRYLLQDIASWVEAAQLDIDQPERHQVRDFEAMGCGLLALGRVDEALPWLERGLTKVHAQGWVLSEILFAHWLAIAYERAGHRESALEALARALALADPQACVGVFGEFGPESVPLLRRVRAMLPSEDEPFRRITPAFVQRVLEIHAEYARAEAPPDAPTLPLEPLSPREMDVLDLLAQGLRNDDIADRLYLTVNTVGFHLKSIYGKLDVHSRTRAVAVARELALV